MACVTHNMKDEKCTQNFSHKTCIEILLERPKCKWENDDDDDNSLFIYILT
jgi:hypothetical protein